MSTVPKWRGFTKIMSTVKCRNGGDLLKLMSMVGIYVEEVGIY